MTLQIKFSHKYSKHMKEHCDILKDRGGALLLEVFQSNAEELHPCFVEYDTLYFDENKNDWDCYKLPKGTVLILLFKSGDYVFTTIRRYTPKKQKYYIDNRGKKFDLVLI